MTQKNSATPDDDLPEHLGHKPVYAMPYQFFDGPPNVDTDARYLSVGLAQWNQNHVSVKIMRHTGGRWTRQAEELPLHRAIDVTSFLAHVIAKSSNEVVRIKPGTFDNQDERLAIKRDENRSTAEMSQFGTFMDGNKEHLRQRLNTLADLLNELRADGKL